MPLGVSTDFPDQCCAIKEVKKGLIDVETHVLAYVKMTGTSSRRTCFKSFRFDSNVSSRIGCWNLSGLLYVNIL